MSSVALPDDPATQTEPVDPPEVVREKAGVDRVVRLLVEYRKKVRRLTARQKQLNEEYATSGEPHPDSRNGKRITPIKNYRPVLTAAEQLARYASGLIESARIPRLDKIELQLRNAELEAELIEAKRTIV